MVEEGVLAARISQKGFANLLTRKEMAVRVCVPESIKATDTQKEMIVGGLLR
jgi:hypothetical protein